MEDISFIEKVRPLKYKGQGVITPSLHINTCTLGCPYNL